MIEYWQGDGKGNVRLSAGTFQRTDFKQLVLRHQDADAFIFAGGISPQLEGEEMKVDYPGFNGGDRTSILLPGIQTDLMKALKSTGKPVIFVMMTGSAVAIPWEAEQIPAILNSWYGGQAAGTAVADIIFGDYNPAGRLPVTFYRGDQDLAAFNDYSMENRTYRYFKGKPLYGFGYGLSYTTFNYDQIGLPKNIRKGQSLSVSIRVTNTGKMDGDEVAQLYVLNTNKSVKAAQKSLKGFQRITLKTGESKVINFTLSPKDLSYTDINGNAEQFKGKIELSIGGQQPDEINSTSGPSIKRSISII